MYFLCRWANHLLMLTVAGLICLMPLVAAWSACLLPFASVALHTLLSMSSLVACPLTLLHLIECGPRAIMHFSNITIKSPCCCIFHGLRSGPSQCIFCNLRTAFECRSAPWGMCLARHMSCVMALRHAALSMPMCHAPSWHVAIMAP